jgi:hypothetical protein
MIIPNSGRLGNYLSHRSFARHVSVQLFSSFSE